MLTLAPPLRRMLRADEQDAVAVAMCAGTKTVALGIPIISAVYESRPEAGLLSLPLIIYHAEQILVGSLITAPLKRWVRRCVERRTVASAAAAADAKVADGADGAGSRASGDGTAGADVESAGGAPPLAALLRTHNNGTLVVGE